MKYTIPFTLLFSIIFFAACSDGTQKTIQHEKSIYAYSLEIGDVNTAIYSIQQLLQLQPDSLFYYDTLAELYYQAERYAPAFNVTETAINKSYNSVRLLQIRAYAASKVERYEDAVISFQDLMDIEPEQVLEYTYQLGLNFYWMQNYETAIKYMTEVANNRDSRYEKVMLYANQGSQQVTYHLSALNIIGYSFMQLQQFDKAEQVYQTVLEENSEFKLAENNYKLLQQIKQLDAKK